MSTDDRGEYWAELDALILRFVNDGPPKTTKQAEARKLEFLDALHRCNQRTIGAFESLNQVISASHLKPLK
jgi:hypothetical protein